MTAAVAITLALLAVADGAFSGFRSSAGRTGLIRHRQSDYRAARRGAALACALLAPVIVAAATAIALHPARVAEFTSTGAAMLAVYVPYALIILAALAAYVSLSWRWRYVASAVILGPLTLLRPAVALAGGALGAAGSGTAVIAALAVVAPVTLLAVEPLADRIWYSATTSLGQPSAQLVDGK